jgi:hypothetical protein
MLLRQGGVRSKPARESREQSSRQAQERGLCEKCVSFSSFTFVFSAPLLLLPGSLPSPHTCQASSQQFCSNTLLLHHSGTVVSVFEVLVPICDARAPVTHKSDDSTVMEFTFQWET